jgi:hypothetical protein
MKSLIQIIHILLIATISCTSDHVRKEDHAETGRAFNDLKEYYEKGTVPPFNDAITGLNSVNDSTRVCSAEYIYALCVQSLEDESNGRSEWRRMPFFYETWESKARGIREHIAYEFGETARSPESIKIARWFITYDYDANNKLCGIKVIRETRCKESDEYLCQLITNLSSDEEITVNVIDEISKRNLIKLSPQIDQLQKHYREEIRDAAYNCAGILGVAQKKFTIAETVTPWITSQYIKIDNLLLRQVPLDAPFVKVVSEIPVSGRGQLKFDYTGWIISEDSAYYTILDYSAQIINAEKRYTKVFPYSLKEAANKLLIGEDLPFHERYGMIRTHSEDWAIPYFTVAEECFKRKMNDEAAELIMKMINRTHDDSTFTYLMRNSFGNLYYNEMLYSFTFERDYQKSIILAAHLSKPEFYDFRYRKTAMELGEQLRKRDGDFVRLTLPSRDIWDSLEHSMPRDEQIKYLAERIKLLNCFQQSQPGGISYKSEQFSVPVTTFIELKQPRSNFPAGFDQEKIKGFEVINPYNELLNMKLSLNDITLLVPYLASHDYILGYSFFRDFQSQRVLHKVSWVVSDIILNSVGKEFLNLNAFDTMNVKTKKREINKIIKWCNINSGMTQQELTTDILGNTNKWSEFEMAMYRSMDQKYKVIPVLVNRIYDFNEEYGVLKSEEIARVIFKIGLVDNSDIDEIKKLLVSSHKAVRLWASLFLIRYSSRDFHEGLKTLKSVLETDNGAGLYPITIEPLLETNKDEALELAEGILQKEGFRESIGRVSDYNREMIKRLFLTGSAEALKFMKSGLSDFRTDTMQYSYNSARILNCDVYLETVSIWKNDESTDMYHDFSNLSIEERMAISKDLCIWLDKQYKMIKLGQTPDIKTKNVFPPVYRIDAPGF